jgi:hypothetical protein
LKLKISTILTEAGTKAKKERRLEILREHDCPALRIFLAVALHPKIEWDLPADADPQYIPNELKHDQEGVLYSEMRRLYMYLKPNHLFHEYNPNLSPERRLKLFVQLLEMVDAEDAIFLVAAAKKKLPLKLSKDTIEEAFPGLLTWGLD